MHLTLVRYACGDKSTMGALSIDGKFACYTLENPWLDNRRRISSIPTGTYELQLRKEGGWHGRAAAKFPGMHKGMIELRDVPGRTYILIHWGNTPRNTDGCVLVGNTASQDFVGNSVKAYEAIYPPIADALVCGERVTFEIIEV